MNGWKYPLRRPRDANHDMVAIVTFGKVATVADAGPPGDDAGHPKPAAWGAS